MATILITGGAGFIGKALSRELLGAGHKVYVLDRMPALDSAVEGTIKIDAGITDPALKYREFWKEIDVVYHLAAMANVDDCRVLRDKAFDVNLYGTYNIAEICQEQKIKMIFASTACVYGDTTEHPSTEDSPTCPMDLYGVTKRAGEEIVKLLPKWVILRFGTTVGPEMRPALATWQFLYQAHCARPFIIAGSGQQTRNWIYIDDLVRGCQYVLDKNINKEIINLVGSESHSVYEMAKMCSEIVNSTSVIEIKYIPRREGDIDKEDISIEKAKRLLGWIPKVSLRDALIKSYMAIEWWKITINPRD